MDTTTIAGGTTVEHPGEIDTAADPAIAGEEAAGIGEQAAAKADSIVRQQPEQVVYSFEATTKRVTASGDSFQVVLEMSGQDWLRYVSNQLHKGTNTVLVKPEQLRWEPSMQEQPVKPATCRFDEELLRYWCVESADALPEPCPHFKSDQSDGLTNIFAGQGVCLCGHPQRDHYKTTGNSLDGIGQTGCMECVCELYEEGEAVEEGASASL